MFSSEKVEAECFDLIRKTSPHIPHFLSKQIFVKGNTFLHNISLLPSWHFPAAAPSQEPPQLGGPGGLGPAGPWVPAPGAGASRPQSRAGTP